MCYLLACRFKVSQGQDRKQKRKFHLKCITTIKRDILTNVSYGVFVPKNDVNNMQRGAFSPQQFWPSFPSFVVGGDDNGHNILAIVAGLRSYEYSLSANI